MQANNLRPELIDDFELLRPHMRRQLRPGYRRPIFEEDAKGFGKQVLDTGPCGLGYVAITLNKPSDAVRNVPMCWPVDRTLEQAGHLKEWSREALRKDFDISESALKAGGRSRNHDLARVGPTPPTHSRTLPDWLE